MSVITKIESQKNKQDRVNIYIDYEFFCGMQNFVCVKHKLSEGMEIDKDKLHTLVIESDYEKALNKCAILLSKTLKTEKQLYDYLIKKSYDIIVIDMVIQKLKEYNYINDKNYAKVYASDNKGKYGINRIKQSLKQKGISVDIIDSVLSTLEIDDNVIFKLAEKFMRNRGASVKSINQLIQHLQYKGFSWNDIKTVVSTYKKGDDYDWNR